MAIRNISEDELEQVGGGISFGRDEREKEETVEKYCPNCKKERKVVPLSGGRYYCRKCRKEFEEMTLSGEGLNEVVC